MRTPMLVIHGDKDYRVPIGEGLRLWYDLQKRGIPSKFLYFPDENHWVLTPGHSRVWYETVLAFLAEHVLRPEWERPRVLLGQRRPRTAPEMEDSRISTRSP